jgi:hypothetical protein
MNLVKRRNKERKRRERMKKDQWKVMIMRKISRWKERKRKME